MTIQEKKQQFALEAESWLLEFADKLSDYYEGTDRYPDIEMAIELVLLLERLDNPYVTEDAHALTMQFEYYFERIESHKFPVTDLGGEDIPFLKPNYLPLPAGGEAYIEFLTKDENGKPIWVAPSALIGQASELRIGDLRLKGMGTGLDADWYKSVDGGRAWVKLAGGSVEAASLIDDTLAAFNKTYSSKKIVSLLSGKVDKEKGKGLSSFDFSKVFHDLLTKIKDTGAINDVWTKEGYKKITDLITVTQGPAFCKEYKTYNALTLDNEPKPYSQLAMVVDATADPNISDTATVKWAMYFWDSYDAKYKLVIAGDVASNLKPKFSGIEGSPYDNTNLKAALDAKLNRADTELFTLAEKNKVGILITTGTGTKVLCDDGLYRDISTLGNNNPLDVDQEVHTYAGLTAIDTTTLPDGWKVFCWDASGDPNIVSGWANYEWDTATAAWVTLLKGDSLNINLADYYTKAEVNNLLAQKVNVVTGSSLVPDAEITKLQSVKANAEPNRAQATQAEAEAGMDSTKDVSAFTAFKSIVKNAVKGIFVTGDADMGGFWGATQLEIGQALQQLKTRVNELKASSGLNELEVAAKIKAEAESADFTPAKPSWWKLAAGVTTLKVKEAFDFLATKVDIVKGLPEDFFVSTSAEGSLLNYKTDTYRTIDLQPITAILIKSTNEIVRNGDDLFFTGNFAYDDSNPIIVGALYGCYIEDNVLKYEVAKIVEVQGFSSCHGLIFHRGRLLMSNRVYNYATSKYDKPGKFAKVNAYDLTDTTVYTLPDAPDYHGGANDILVYKDRIFSLINNAYWNPAKLVSIDINLTSHQLIQTLSGRVGATPPSIIYNNKLYMGTIPDSTSVGIDVYDLEGNLLQSSERYPVPDVNKYVPGPHWMGIFNGKVLMTSNYDSCIIRVDANTLEFEDIKMLDFSITDDNSILRDGYVYLNGEYSSYHNVPEPSLLKIKYNDFTDFSVEKSPYGTGGKGSWGSINVLPEIEAEKNPLTATKRELDGSHNIVEIPNKVAPVISAKGTKGATGVAEVASLDITAICTTAGDVTVTLDGVAFPVTLATTDNTTDLVASKIRAAAYAGWTTGGTLSNVTFTNNATGARVDATYSAGTTGATGTMTTTTQGVTDTRTAYDYFVVAEDRNGFKTLPSPKGTITDGSPALDATNYNSVVWNWMSGAVKYYVLKGTTGQLLGSTTKTYFEDKGQLTSAFTPPVRNETADVSLAGRITSASLQSKGFELRSSNVVTYYDSFTDAITAAVAGDTIDMYQDWISSAQIVIDKSINIQTNGFSIINEQDANTQTLYIYGAGVVVNIWGNGIIVRRGVTAATPAGFAFCIYAASGATVNLYGHTYNEVRGAVAAMSGSKVKVYGNCDGSRQYAESSAVCLSAGAGSYLEIFGNIISRGGFAISCNNSGVFIVHGTVNQSGSDSAVITVGYNNYGTATAYGDIFNECTGPLMQYVGSNSDVRIGGNITTIHDTIAWQTATTPVGNKLTFLGLPVYKGTIDANIEVTYRHGLPAYLVGGNAFTGSQVVQALAKPTAPTITNVGTAGTTGYVYQVIAEDKNGKRTTPSDLAITTTGNAALDATNYNEISWTAVKGAVKYYVTKNDTSTLLATTTGTSVNDTGQATSVYSPPTRNETGDVSGTLNGSDIVAGTVADARLSSNVVLENQTNTFTAYQEITSAAAGGNALAAKVATDTGVRFLLTTDGRHEWGDGAAARDTNLYRSSAGELKTDGKLYTVGSVTVGGVIYTRDGVSNFTSKNNSLLALLDTGAELVTSIAGNVVATIKNTVSNATGDLTRWVRGTVIVAKVTAEGVVDAADFRKAGVKAFVDTTYVNSAAIVGISDVPATEKTKLETAANWDASGNYIGAPLVNTAMGMRHYTATHVYTAMEDNLWIRSARV